MRENANYIELFEPARISEDYRQKGGRAKFTIHPALYHIDFRTIDEESNHRPYAVEDDAHFRWHRNDAAKDNALEDVERRAYLG